MKNTNLDRETEELFGSLIKFLFRIRILKNSKRFSLQNVTVFWFFNLPNIKFLSFFFLKENCPILAFNWNYSIWKTYVVGFQMFSCLHPIYIFVTKILRMLIRCFTFFKNSDDSPLNNTVVVEFTPFMFFCSFGTFLIGSGR